MTSNFRIAPVTSTDIPTLGHLFAHAFADDALQPFLFTHGPALDLAIKTSIVRY